LFPNSHRLIYLAYAAERRSTKTKLLTALATQGNHSVPTATSLALLKILIDPCRSDCFKAYCADSKRDPCDALAELEYGARLYNARC
jgi:hypothetical protein